MQFSRMFCPLAIPLRATVTNNPPAGRGCSYLPGAWNTYTQGSQPEKGAFKKHLNNHKPQRSFIFFCSLPVLEELFLFPLQLWLQAHTQSHICRSLRKQRWDLLKELVGLALVPVQSLCDHLESKIWGLKTNLVSFLASSLIQERQHELVARTAASPLGQGQGCAPLSSKPFQAQQILKHTKKWQPKAGNAG